MNGRQAKAPEEVGIKRAKNGGFIVRHSFNNMGAGESYRMPEEHAFTDHASMLAHVTKVTKQGPSADVEGDDEGATRGTGPKPKVSATPDRGTKRPAGVAGKAKASPPNQRTYGAGAD